MSRFRGERALVGNAADPRQVKRATELEQFADDRRLNGWRYLLATELGRELAWSLLADCNVFTGIMAQSPYIFENAGRHDWGLKMMDEIIRADDALYLLMQKEAIARKKNQPVGDHDTPAGDEADA